MTCLALVVELVFGTARMAVGWIVIDCILELH